MRVGGQLLEEVQRVRHAVAPVAEHARGRGPGAEVRRGEHALQQLHVDDVVVLVHPERFEHVVLVIRVVLVERGDPLLRCRDDLVAVAAAQLDPGAVANAVSPAP